MNWRLAYAIGFHPWEDTDQEFSRSLASLLEREEQGREPPYGRALDVGTGSAIWGVELAKRGWEVTGVDYVEKALERGRERVQAAGVDMKLVQGDAFQAAATAGMGAAPGRTLVPPVPCMNFTRRTPTGRSGGDCEPLRVSRSCS